jgi:hypothetical protein
MVAAVIPKHVISGRDRVQRRERDARAKERESQGRNEAKQSRHNFRLICVLYINKKTTNQRTDETMVCFSLSMVRAISCAVLTIICICIFFFPLCHSFFELQGTVVAH